MSAIELNEPSAIGTTDLPGSWAYGGEKPPTTEPNEGWPRMALALSGTVDKAVKSHIDEFYGHVQLVHSYINLSSKEGPPLLHERIKKDFLGVLRHLMDE